MVLDRILAYRALPRGLCLLLALSVCGCAPVRSRPIVGLLTDYGSEDAYAGVLQAAVLGQCPDATLVNITHEVPAYDTAAGSFLLAVASREFPAGSVFCVVVDPGVGTARRSVIVRTRQQRLFVGPDNGLFSDIIVEQGLEQAWQVDERRLPNRPDRSTTFHGRDVYGPIAGALAAGAMPERFGKPLTDPTVARVPNPRREHDRLVGTVRYIDHYGNILTDLPGDWLKAELDIEGRMIDVAAGGSHLSCRRVATYADVAVGEGVVVANSLGLLEIARNQSSAAQSLAGVKTGSAIELRLAKQTRREPSAR